MPRKTENLENLGAYGEMTGEKRATMGADKVSIASTRGTSRLDSPRGKVGTLDYIGADFCPNGSKGDISNINDLINLSKAAFHSVPAYRNSLLTQVALSNTKLIVRGPNAGVANFFKTWLTKTQMWDFTNQVMLEYLRSGNVFIYKLKTDLKLNEIRKFTKEVYAKNRSVPIKYMVLDPSQIRGQGGASLINQVYCKILTSYEVERLRAHATPEDLEIYNSFTEEEKKAINSSVTPQIVLKPENLSVIQFAKMSYEQMATPPYVGALKSINLKLAMRQAELIITETVDMIVLLMRCGNEAGALNGFNKGLVQHITQLMSARGIGRVLTVDSSVSGEFLLPDLNKVMDPKKYESLDREINAAMMDLFSLASSSNFAASYVTTQIYLETLNQIRDTFLNNFLLPEVRKVAEEMGFTEDSIPEISFEEITLESKTEKLKLYIRLYETGNLTSKGLTEAFKTGFLPLDETNLTDQKEFKKEKDNGLWSPIAPEKAVAEGRPTGSKAPQSKKDQKPAGASIETIRENLVKMDEIFELVETAYKKKYGITRIQKKHKELAGNIAVNVIASEPIGEWKSRYMEYLDNPIQAMTAQKMEILELSAEFEMTTGAAAILFHGKNK